MKTYRQLEYSNSDKCNEIFNNDVYYLIRLKLWTSFLGRKRLLRDYLQCTLGDFDEDL